MRARFVCVPKPADLSSLFRSFRPCPTSELCIIGLSANIYSRCVYRIAPRLITLYTPAPHFEASA